MIKSMTAVQEALAQFNQLPDSAFVRLPVVISLFSCSRATLWRWVKCAQVPAPKKLGVRITAWNVGELRQKLNEIQQS